MTLPSFIADITVGAARLRPEAVLLTGLVGTLLLDLTRRPAASRVATGLTVAALVVAGGMLWVEVPATDPFFQRMLVADAASRTGGLLVVVGALLAYALLKSGKQSSPDLFRIPHSTFLLTLTLGGLLLARSVHGIGLVLAVELLSLPSYALVLTRRDDARAAEAALKYVLLGAVATGALLYGLSLLYGLAGSLHFADGAFWQNLRLAPTAPVVAAWGLVLAGLLFKLGAAPLHFWVPDAYDGAPLPVALLLSTAPKAATAVALWRLADGWRQHLTEPQAAALAALLAGAALLSLVVGTLGALTQGQVRRLLGYSSVAQAGFLLLTIHASAGSGVGVVLLYTATLVLANGATFLGVASFEARVAPTGEGDQLLAAAYSGLGRRYPLPAVALTIGLVALTGLPPTVSFQAKLLAFTGLWNADATTLGRVLLAVGVLVTAASLYYYLRLPYYLFLKEPVAGSQEPEVGTSPPAGYGLGLAVGLAGLLLLFFIKADWLLALLR